MLYWLMIYVGGVVCMLILLPLLQRLEGQSLDESEVWHYVWSPALLWPISAPLYLVAYIDFALKWLIVSPPKQVTQAPHHVGKLCSHCSAVLAPKAMFCGRCGERAAKGQKRTE
jgi:ribosomal protein L40E